MPLIDPKIQDGLLTIRQTLEDERIRIALEGELDLSNTETAEASLQEALATGQDVLVDLGKLEFLDSTGISLLVLIMRQKENGLSFAPSESAEVTRLLGLTGLDERMRRRNARSEWAATGITESP